MYTQYYINNDENGIQCEVGNTRHNSNWKKLNGWCVHKVARYTKIHIHDNILISRNYNIW